MVSARALDSTTLYSPPRKSTALVMKSPRQTATPASPPASPRVSSPDQRFALGRSLAALPRSSHRPIGAEADAETSHAVGEGLRCQVLQRPARFSVFACDRFGGHLCTGGDAFTVSIRGPSLVWPSLHDNEDGSYECEWQASVSGVYMVAVMLQGEHIAGSPWAARAIAPGADPSQCRVRTGSSPVHGVAGLPACFDIEFFDALGQGIAMEPPELQTVLKTAEACAVRVKHKGNKAQQGPESVHLLLSAHEGDDRYPEQRCRASVTVESAGHYQLHVLMQPNRQPLQGSPLELHVRPGAPSAARSAVLAQASEKRARAGQRRTFTIQTQDAWGNVCDAGGARVAISVPEAVQATLTDLNDGNYEVRANDPHSIPGPLPVPGLGGTPIVRATCVRRAARAGGMELQSLRDA